jgi:hypothetical protein
VIPVCKRNCIFSAFKMETASSRSAALRLTSKIRGKASGTRPLPTHQEISLLRPRRQEKLRRQLPFDSTEWSARDRTRHRRCALLKMYRVEILEFSWLRFAKTSGDAHVADCSNITPSSCAPILSAHRAIPVGSKALAHSRPSGVSAISPVDSWLGRAVD